MVVYKACTGPPPPARPQTIVCPIRVVWCSFRCSRADRKLLQEIQLERFRRASSHMELPISSYSLFRSACLHVVVVDRLRCIVRVGFLASNHGIRSAAAVVEALSAFCEPGRSRAEKWQPWADGSPGHLSRAPHGRTSRTDDYCEAVRVAAAEAAAPVRLAAAALRPLLLERMSPKQRC
jgi:hypothetical protein